MSVNGEPAQTADDGAVGGEKPACMALVPVVPTVQWSRVPDQPKSRADFVTQLIATAQHAPQTCSLRRASPTDAQAAYSANRRPLHGAGILTRQII